MSAALYFCLLCWCLQNSAAGVDPTPPRDVTMITMNTHYILSWDYGQSAADSHNVTFTTQYVAKYKLKSKKKDPIWSTSCKETSEMSCDLTACNLHYLGIYMLRVRANVNRNHSDWVHMEFCPDKDAAVGPPSTVNLAPAGSDLDVFISDPLTSTNSSMKEHLPKLYYDILYWERSLNRQASTTQTVSSSASLVTLPNLKPWTWYCVSVQTRYDFYNKSSSFTSPHCMQTEGATPWWQIFVYFLGSLVICFVVVLLSLYGSFWCCKTFKTALYPPNQLPPHFKDYLFDSPASDVPRLLTPDSESLLLCDNVTVCPESTVLEIHNPPLEDLPTPTAGLDPDNSGRHSRQDSSSSGDSGVYSTGGSSNLRQSNTTKSSAGAQDSCQGLCDSEQMKMQEMAPGLNSPPLIADEGVVDMCV
ncbi:interleukin-10 receptor subunit beta-like [Stegastes partitus]|uniref:Interleukin-10 receptor subunit beta-like n=1 Tax=Stegastes partitus TaxID=144197 RepID=A0A3B4ZZ17_9TELE|nr:PREDICTED: interleukin-10 receptor subunit beta-like [Stegastes partitus]